MRLALRYGLLHALVDAATVTVVFRTTGTHDLAPSAIVALVIAYDMIAFGTQLPLGAFTDRWLPPTAMPLIGLGLAAASVAAHPVAPVGAVVLAGCGNAAFHLGAGARVLALGLDRATPAGLFVAPGALGLGFGVWFGADPARGPAWPLGVLLAAVGMIVAIRWRTGAAAPRAAAGPAAVGPVVRTVRRDVAYGALVLLLTSIAIRSLVGLSAARGYPKGVWLMIGLPLAGFLGKSLGGFIADRLGWLETTVGALLIAAPVLAVRHANPVPLLLGLVIFQMTMPVTLVAVARLMPTRLATAFGWTCFALAVGSVPAVFSWGSGLGTRPLLFGWILVAAVAGFAGLDLIGVRRRIGTSGAPATGQEPESSPAG